MRRTQRKCEQLEIVYLIANWGWIINTAIMEETSIHTEITKMALTWENSLRFWNISGYMEKKILAFRLALIFPVQPR